MPNSSQKNSSPAAGPKPSSAKTSSTRAALSQKVLTKIRAEKITPAPKWHFIAIEYLFWLLVFSMTILGALAFSLILFAVFNLDWDLHRYAPMGVIRFFFVTIPHLWITLFILFFFSTLLIVKKTKKGYRYQVPVIIALILPASMVLGTAIYALGLGDRLEAAFSHRAPRLHQLSPTPEKQWNNPGRGLLGGEIIAVRSDSIILLLDFSQHQWSVQVSPETQIARQVELKAGEKIKIIGVIAGDNSFRALFIRPWQGHNPLTPPQRPPGF